MTENPNLSHEARALIRQYLLRLVAPGGAVALVMASFLGYAVNELVIGSAYQDAYSGAFSNVMNTIESNASAAAVARAQAETARDGALQVQRELNEVIQDVSTSELLTSTERQISEIANALSGRSEFIARVDGMQEFRDFNREVSPVTVDVPGGTGWGAWRAEVYCPRNHYVCGVRQRVEGSQGRGDDTSVNDIELRCCPLFAE